MLSKIKAYGVLIKFKLNITVVLSAVLSYIACADQINYTYIFLLSVGGFLVTGAANAINQIIEKDLDKLMVRTQNRPLVTGEISEINAAVVAGIFAFVGTILLFAINFSCGFLGALAIFLYTAVYTPSKRSTPFSVLIGAVPGSIPPMLGALAATGSLMHIHPWVLFGIQFIWQFPHFWSIAWKSFEDYQRAGFKMLPSGAKDKSSAFQIVVYSLLLVPTSLLPYFFKISGIYSALFMCFSTIAFAYLAIDFYKDLSNEKAKVLMVSSFFYLPLIQIAMCIDKL